MVQANATSGMFKCKDVKLKKPKPQDPVHRATDPSISVSAVELLFACLHGTSEQLVVCNINFNESKSGECEKQ